MRSRSRAKKASEASHWLHEKGKLGLGLEEELGIILPVGQVQQVQ